MRITRAFRRVRAEEVGGCQKTEQKDGKEKEEDINRNIIVLGRIQTFHDRQTRRQHDTRSSCV